MQSLDAMVTTLALTFVIGELQVVVHGGNKLLHDETPDDRSQVAFAPHLPPEDLDVVICPRVKEGQHVKATRGRANANKEVPTGLLWRGRSL